MTGADTPAAPSADTPAAPSAASIPVVAFVRQQLGQLGPFEFLSLGSAAAPFVATQVGRTEDGAFELRLSNVEGDALPVPQRVALVERGFSSADPADGRYAWSRQVDDLDSALDGTLQVLQEVLGTDLGDRLDVVHGSTRAAHEAQLRLAELRSRIEPMLAEIAGAPPRLDEDGDYELTLGGVRVVVVPRAVPGAISVVRILTITNNDVAVGPELGLFLARLNFGLTFGRFALDIEHRSIWFDETLLGEDLTDGQLRFTVEMVARTAQEWRSRLQQMFGGIIDDGAGAPRPGEPPNRPKPGAGGYL